MRFFKRYLLANKSLLAHTRYRLFAGADHARGQRFKTKAAIKADFIHHRVDEGFAERPQPIADRLHQLLPVPLSLTARVHRDIRQIAALGQVANRPGNGNKLPVFIAKPAKGTMAKRALHQRDVPLIETCGGDNLRHRLPVNRVHVLFIF